MGSESRIFLADQPFEMGEQTPGVSLLKLPEKIEIAKGPVRLGMMLSRLKLLPHPLRF